MKKTYIQPNTLIVKTEPMAIVMTSINKSPEITFAEGEAEYFDTKQETYWDEWEEETDFENSIFE